MTVFIVILALLGIAALITMFMDGSFVEFCILVVIFGLLLAAMAIPAYQKVK